MLETGSFAAFARRKEQAAQTAALEPFATTVDNSADFSLDAISSPFTDALLDGRFFQSSVPPGSLPALSLVFVQSRDGNTEAHNPSILGGGNTDKHVIYEGLSRVAADAVLAGARTIGKGHMLLSVWHPALVSLRQALGKPRHPVQVVLTASGEIPIEQGLLFNVPEIPVIVLSSNRAARRLVERSRSRPWITVISTGAPPDVRRGAERLRTEFGIERISAVGGRFAATALIDAGLVSDLYLTTSAIAAGTRDTPMYTGTRPPRRELVLRKESVDGIVFEHFVVRPPH
jgi:5-amino-6-(5-phosphoribosylamino)uracil reductase